MSTRRKTLSADNALLYLNGTASSFNKLTQVVEEFGEVSTKPRPSLLALFCPMIIYRDLNYKLPSLLNIWIFKFIASFPNMRP